MVKYSSSIIIILLNIILDEKRNKIKWKKKVILLKILFIV